MEGNTKNLMKINKSGLTQKNMKKYENKEDLKEDMAEFYEDIFKYRPRK